MQAIKRFLALALICAAAVFAQISHADAAITLVAHTLGSDASGSGTTPNVNATGGNLILIFVASYQGTGFVSLNNPTDSSSNTYFHRATLKSSSVGYVLDLWECVGCTVTSSMNFTVTGTSDFSTFTVQVYSGVATSGAYGNSTITQIASGQTSAAAGSITPTTNGSLVVSSLLFNDSMTSTATIGSGLTITDQQVHATGEGNGSAYLIQPTAAAINPVWTTNTGSYETVVLNAYYNPSGAAPPATGKLLPVAIP